MEKPKTILVFSGKRKSGKDYLASKLLNILDCKTCAICRLSEPLKYQYAKIHNLDYKTLLDSSSYKEKYRADMIRWGEEKRNEDPSYFCNLSTHDCKQPVWVISDARRITDIQYFKDKYKEIVKIVRVTATDATRQKRGFVFSDGIDNAESECGLDNYRDWDFMINNDESKIMEAQFSDLLNYVNLALR